MKVKNVFCFMCVIVLVFFAACNLFTNDNTDNESTKDPVFSVYDVSASKTVSISGYNGSGGEVKIPIKIDGKVVVGINRGVFQNKNITSISIPNTITLIEDSVFENNQLTSIVIPDSITIVESTVFRDNQLTSVVIPDSVIRIEVGAFASNQLTSITIGAGLVLETEAFSDYYNRSSGFETAYNSYGRAAGTYTRTSTSSTVWIKE